MLPAKTRPLRTAELTVRRLATSCNLEASRRPASKCSATKGRTTPALAAAWPLWPSRFAPSCACASRCTPLQTLRARASARANGQILSPPEPGRASRSARLSCCWPSPPHLHVSSTTTAPQSPARACKASSPQYPRVGQCLFILVTKKVYAVLSLHVP